MRRDEEQQLQEQRQHYLAELRALGDRQRDGQAWSREDKERFDYVERELRTIDNTLREQHEKELEEIRQGRAGGNGFQAAGPHKEGRRGSALPPLDSKDRVGSDAPPLLHRRNWRRAPPLKIRPHSLISAFGVGET
jgi:hypothetical protein